MKRLTALCVDAGNSRVKWARIEVESGASSADPPGARLTKVLESGSQPTVQVRAGMASLPAADGQIVWAANVAGAELDAQLRAQYPNLHLHRSCTTLAGVTTRYSPANGLGVDRHLAVLAAHQVPGMQLVVMAGTAVTIDVLHADGTHLGGVILPGLELMRQALNRGTAQLPMADSSVSGIPTTTATAIGTGTVLAVAGAIAMMRQRARQQGVTVTRITASGGAWPVLAPYLLDAIDLPNCPCHWREHLVLEGLAIAGAYTLSPY
jgi:type III pantothenate kinase